MPVLLATGLLAAGPALAVHKCVDAAGRVTYSDAPCPSATARAGQLRATPNQIDGAGEAAEAGAAFVQREQARQALERRNVQARDAEVLQAWSAGSAAKGPDTSSPACRQAMKDYDWASRNRSAHDRLTSAEAVAVRAHCGADMLPPAPARPEGWRTCVHAQDTACIRR
ncbi:DUF4124 domain-containing protein [Ideonella sp.]|uniref:DUF4124 domain-containing protein n=1 Tax=Ideonella sp. TaxID=1929293 RepID=UPI0035B106BC